MTRLAAALLLALVAVTAARADDPNNYPFNLAKTNPKALAAWQHVVPDRLKRIAWVYRLDGTADQMRRVEIAGKPYLLGWVCKPHDCGNQLAFLVAVDLSRAAGVVRSEETGRVPLWLGAPTPGETEALQKKLNGD